jgi:hypothetical protein
MTKQKIQALRTKWVDALRSGEYKRCTGRLSQWDDGTISYCPLGVLSKILYGRITEQAYSSMPFLDLPRTLDMSIYHNNDAKGWSFDQMADELEKVYERYPVRSFWGRTFGKVR